MIRKIQWLKKWAESQEEKAINECAKYFMLNEDRCAAEWGARGAAFSEIVEQLTLLLDSENENSSQSSQGDGSNSSNAM